jgi:hypothetical protein
MKVLEQRINNMMKWCDSVAVKWTNNGTKKVTPKYKYNNKNCSKKGGYCRFCNPSRKKAYFCNSYVIAACLHGLGFKLHGFKNDCKKWRGGGTGGQMRRDFNPSVKAGTGWTVVSGITESRPIFCNTNSQINAANSRLKRGDVLIIARTDNKKKKPRICHTAIWYGNGMVTECAGDAGCCTRTAKKLDRGQGRCIVKVYRFVGTKLDQAEVPEPNKKKPTSSKKEPAKKEPSKKSDKKTDTKKKKKYPYELPKLPKRGYLKIKDKGLQVKRLQRFLNWYWKGKYKLAIDGDFGRNTRSVLKAFQKKEKLVPDGYFGTKSLARARKITK